MRTDMWDELKRRLHPDAWKELPLWDYRNDRPLRADEVVSQAVALHHAYTGVTLTFHF